MIIDPYGRPVTSIRVSVTQKCNLNCFYCHHEGEDDASSRSGEMSPDEIERILTVVSSFGIGRVKLTGGEPLMRSDILEIVEKISGIPGISEVSMTTNGVFLNDLAKPLKDAGLGRVNVSLDTLDAETYRMITGVDALEKVISGIHSAVEAGLNPVKINMVLLKDVNDDEVWRMIDFAERSNTILQLIELESANENGFYKKYHRDMVSIEKELKSKAKKIIIRSMHHRRKYLLQSKVEVEVVKPMHNTEFCRYCNRIRVTSDGKFKPCLFRSDNLIDFLGPMRNGASIEDLKRLFIEAVKRRKPYFT